MKKIYTAENPMTAFHYKNILENHGIDCLIKNFYLSGAQGDIPQSECVPELWILKDSNYEKAKILIETNQNSPQSGKFWVCKNCHEKIETQFTECWKCGKSA